MPNTGKMSDFQFGVPGVIVFGVLFGTITSALMVVREASSGTLARMRLSGAGGGQVLGGIVLANLVMALVQVPLSFAAALAFGFRSPGSLLLATGIGLVLSLGATGCGFLSACFARSEGGATAVSTAVMVPLVFLSGAIFPMPPAKLFSLGGQTVQVYDLMPRPTRQRRCAAYWCTAMARQPLPTSWACWWFCRWRCSSWARGFIKRKFKLLLR